MATAIASLPNEVKENKVVMQVTEKNQKVPNPPKQAPIQQTTELSQESIHQIVQGLQQAGGSTLLPNREIPTNKNIANSNLLNHENNQTLIKKSNNINYHSELVFDHTVEVKNLEK